MKNILLLSIMIACLPALGRESDEFRQSLNRRRLMDVPANLGQDVRVVFFDADSTLRVSKSGLPWATNDHDYIVLPGVVEKLKEFNQQGYILAIVSNQGRIPESLSLNEADDAFMNLIKDLRRVGVRINYFDFADQVNEDRKPGIGMYQRLERVLKVQLGQNRTIDRTRSLMVGDAGYTKKEKMPDGQPGHDFSDADRLFAENAQIQFHYAPEFFGWKRFGITQIKNRFQAFLTERRSRLCQDALAGWISDAL